MLEGKKIGFIGGGNMAEALLKGLKNTGFPLEKVSVAEPLSGRRTFLSENYGVNVTGDNKAVAAGADVIVLAVKPQVALQVLDEIGQNVTQTQLLISIMAGVTTATMESSLSPAVPVVRAMPNTPALVLQGATAMAAGQSSGVEHLSLARQLFESVGRTWVVGEGLMDAVTGLSGSGPAYVLTFIEALADAGVKEGLSRDVAAGLAAQTVFGTAALLRETGEHPAILRERVTSPGGTTIAGLHVLEREAFRGTIMNAVDAATERSRQLGRK